MDNRKIYNYFKLDTLDVFDSIDWARENYHRYNGEISPLWNKYVQQEFIRINNQFKSMADFWRQILRHTTDDSLLLKTLGFLEKTN